MNMEEKQNIKTWIKLKISEIFIQVIVVVISIVLALTVDEWRDRKSRAELADRVLVSVIEELKSNKQELQESITENDTILSFLTQEFKIKKQSKEGIQFSVSQLSSAAWQTAQGTQALHLIDLDRLLQFARVYELQSLYNSNQNKIVEEIGQTWLDEQTKEVQMVRKKVFVQIATVNQIGKEVLNQYKRVLSDSSVISKP
jgi:hypothetical protein